MFKTNKYIHKFDSRNSDDYYFIKPFEIPSSYITFIKTWQIANQCTRECNEVSGIKLMQSFSSESNYGYVSISKWKSKESFIKSNLENPVLKYHNFVGSNGNSFYTQNLYKLFSENIYSKIPLSLIEIQIVFFESLSTNDTEIRNYLELINRELKENVNVHSIQILKSVYKTAKFRYIVFIYHISGSANEINLLSEKFVSNNYNTRFTMNTSFYNIIKRINQNTKPLKTTTQ